MHYISKGIKIGICYNRRNAGTPPCEIVCDELYNFLFSDEQGNDIRNKKSVTKLAHPFLCKIETGIRNIK